MAEVPEGAVVVTTADIYRQLLDLTQAVGQLNGAIQGLATKVAALDDHETRIRTIEGYGVHDHDARLTSLERARWPLPALAVLVAIAALIVPLMKH